MKSSKIALSATAGLCALLLTGVPAAQAAEAAFQDTAGHWAESAIARMSGYNIVNGYQGKFRPNDTITRGEMAVILDHVMQYQRRADNQFTDLGQAFYTDAILKAGHAGVMQGADGKVRPKDPISREEAVVMMARAFDVEAANAVINTPDAGSISKWATGSVAAFMEKGYVNAENAFRPEQSITRAEAVTILNRLLVGYYPSAGSYAASAEGNVVVNTQDVVLKDAVIAGDLILSEGVKDGDVTLENVTVKGRTLIRGGGANSIHVMGNSDLGTVIMERDDAAVRLAVEGKAKVGSVVVGEKAAQAIVTGSVETVTVTGTGVLTAKDAQIDKISVTAPDASVVLQGKSKVDSVEIAKSAENAKVSVDQKAAIKTVKADAVGAAISGDGRVNKVEANADKIAVNTKDTAVTAAAGVSGVTAGGESVPAGGSANTTPSTGGGGGSSQESNNVIANVESIRNGLVRLTLKQATDAPLRKEQISIICTGAGKNMTVIDLHTQDNRVYDIRTAYYNDNTYQLGLTMDDGTLYTYDFVSKYDCPALTSVEAVRVSPDGAEFSYVSDIAGTFYWMLKPDQAARAGQPAAVGASNGVIVPGQTANIRAAADEPTAEEIMKDGKQQKMELHSNTVTLSGLAEHTSYTMYYVAKGTDDKVTPVKSVKIAGEPSELPQTSDILIEKAEAYRIPNTDFMDEHIYFEIALSQATDTELTVDQFKFSCPADSNMPLGRVETADKKLYKVYMEKGYMIKDNNHFTCTITFADQTQAVKKFFVDLTAPNLTGFQITRAPGGKAKVTFSSSEPGKIYWKVMKGDEFGLGSSGAKDPNLVVKDGAIQEIQAGQQYMDIDFAAQAAEKGLYFCFVSEDKLGNRSFFWYEAIPDNETAPTPDPLPGKYQVVSITGQVEEQIPSGKGHVLTVKLNENSTGMSLFTNDGIKITGEGAIISGHQKISVACSSADPTEHTITLRGTTLKEGTYTFEASIDQDNAVKATFTVDAAGNVALKA